MKKLVKKLLYLLHLDITRNMQYDRKTERIIKRVLSAGSTCVDIGCHRGEVLDTIIKQAPHGHHYAFEPIPELFAELQERYRNRSVTVSDTALSDATGTAEFNFIENAPAYSGLKIRRYDISNPIIRTIKVTKDTLDRCLPGDEAVAFIKLDVEGGEFNVLRGARETIKRCRPVIVFECGLGSAEYYGTNPGDLHDFLTRECGMNVSTLDRWLNGKTGVSRERFEHLFETGAEYYFIAYPQGDRR
ncbi:MAG: FkbM family methyltransferase [Candidatus Edwardsbacteria bacterium]|jgi:FkbM family methyltransferase|nr:FkbM family methyltransferase [Candidatus Edwardsbacteria bacterium]